jgi:hypothetical protein
MGLLNALGVFYVCLRRLGFLEIGVELVYGLLLIAAYWAAP